jgi:hypothetical protein
MKSMMEVCQSTESTHELMNGANSFFSAFDNQNYFLISLEKNRSYGFTFMGLDFNDST